MMLTYLERRVGALEMIQRDQMRSSSSRRSEKISFLDKPRRFESLHGGCEPGVVQCADIWQILARHLISQDISQLAHHNHKLSI